MKKFLSLMLSGLMLLGLAACGGEPAPAGDKTPDPVQDMPSYQSVDENPVQTYDLTVEPNTDVLESLMASYDQSTAVAIDASGEMSAMAEAHGELEDIVSELPPMSGEPAALPLVLKPEASGTKVMSNSNCKIDYSNTADGYFMAKWTASPQKIKLQSTGPSGVTYTYDLYGNDWAAFPFSDGNGNYNIRVMQNVGGTKYAVAGKINTKVKMTDEFAPFLRPNQYVNYENATDTTAKAAELCQNMTTDLDKVAAVYDWVTSNLTYDYNKAANVQSGYLPDLDSVLASKTGICFDYAALMTGMLRSQGVACRLIVGYAGSAYHAWISVYVNDLGWVDGVIFFNGVSWQRMDPTYASTGKGNASVLQYIGDGSNYSAKYQY